jgi:hypothetical protein
VALCYSLFAAYIATATYKNDLRETIFLESYLVCNENIVQLPPQPKHLAKLELSCFMNATALIIAICYNRIVIELDDCNLFDLISLHQP